MENLNPEQREAILHTDGPLLIFAGAGSGKTRVLVHRIAHLMEACRVSPWEIFSVTFTNKAAQEMKERIGHLVGRRADDLWISTFHSAGVRILRRHITQLGYGQSFVIYDDSDQQQILKSCLDELGINPKIFTPRAISSRIDAAKNELIEPDQYPTGDFFNEKVALVYQLYAKRLKDNNALDFGDLLLLPVKLFRNFPAVLQDYQQRLRYLMVDEYQDTNHAQYVLIKLLAAGHHNLCVVGDDDQSIYRWRGADIRNILEFEKDFPNAKMIKLEQNYRSTKNILHAAAQVVKPIKQRQDKTLWTDNEDGEKITVFKGQTDREEAIYVVDKIKSHRSSGAELASCAIFYRTNAQSRVFEDELRRHNIPYVIYGGVRFYDRLEVKDMLAYLWVIANPADGLHLKRALGAPSRGIGKTSVEKLEQFAIQQGSGLYENLLQAKEAGLQDRAAKPLHQFYQLIENLKEFLKREKLSQFVRNLYERTGYLAALKAEATTESEARIENLEELARVVEEYEFTNPEPSLAGFLDQVALVNEVQDAEDRKRALPLMTLHLAKGLEFQTVFFVGLEEGLLPHSRALEAQEDLDEERRLTYVGMTRARRKLYLTHAERRRVFGKEQYNLSSRFLDGLPEEILERIEVPRWDEGKSYSLRGSSDFFQDFPRREIPRAAPAPVEADNPYRAGLRVQHPVFGLGTIQQSEGSAENRKVTVAFQSAGTKKLLARIANLTILGS